MRQKKHRSLLLTAYLFGILVLFAIPRVANAVALPCTPSSVQSGQYQNDVFNCVNSLYLWALVASSIAAVFMIILGGYLYIFSGGSESRVGTAKSFISTSLLGITVLVAGFLVLQQINPSILEVKNISPPQIGQQDWFKIPIEGDQSTVTAGSVDPGALTNTIPGQGDSRIYSIAASQVGRTESPKGSNTGPDINQYFGNGVNPGVPWCTVFTSWAFGQAGYTTIGSYSGRAGTFNMMNFFKTNNGKTFTDNGKTYTVQYFSSADVKSGRVQPLPGDMAFFDRGAVGGSDGHSGIVQSFSGTNITVINGNIKDSVVKATFNINQACNSSGENGVCGFFGLGRVVPK